MSTLVLHDYFEALEGGGHLSQLLAQHVPADLGYGFARPHHPLLTPLTAIKQYNLQVHSRIPLWRQFKLARAFAQQTSFIKQYDNVIYSGFYTPLAVEQHRRGANILYCHTPPRFIYDQRAFYRRQIPAVARPVLKAFIDYLQPRYEQAVAQMDQIIANSANVRQRIQQYLAREAIVIYPPCDTQRFVWQGQGDYYLSMARLDPLKRVDWIIRAFLQRPDKRLIVASGGSEYARLQQLAQGAPHIELTHWLSAEQLAQLVGDAIATIYIPTEEDFGMSVVESMAAGKPVIGVAEGGLLETIIPQHTGLLLKPPLTLAALCEAVEYLTPQRALTMRSACEQQAARFRTEIFLKRIREILN
ncbi:MAG: glycosyltransferase [Pseudomonadota bacterium]|nr:glycosyltransferase [Pseudomonadota bacterium]